MCHESQVNPDVADWIRQRNAEAGQEAGYAYAEVFRVMRFFRDDDTTTDSEAADD
jgi:hypothetical protein